MINFLPDLWLVPWTLLLIFQLIILSLWEFWRLATLPYLFIFITTLINLHLSQYPTLLLIIKTSLSTKSHRFTFEEVEVISFIVFSIFTFNSIFILISIRIGLKIVTFWVISEAIFYHDWRIVSISYYIKD